MKILSEPSSGKIRNEVAYISRYGQCRREYVIPKNTWSPARDHMRGSFGRLSRAWSGLLTEAQRDAWCEAGPKVQSAKRLGKSGPLTGQQHFQGINSARARLGLDMLLTPPAPVAFGPSPVGQLVITNDDNGVRLLLPISGPVPEDIMVFGQAPCNSGRRKRRNVSYLGLLTTAQAGLSEITALYVARFGEPGVGQRVFIVTRQQKDGWEGFDQETHEIVPDKPSAHQAATPAALPLPVPMHKGCTRDAQGIDAPLVLGHQDTAPCGPQDYAGSRRGRGLSRSTAKRLPTTPPAWVTVTGSPMRPKCKKVKNMRPLIASTPALPTTSMKPISPIRCSVEPGGWPATDSKAETTLRPWQANLFVVLALENCTHCRDLKAALLSYSPQAC